jgi:hypothetical protein
MTSRALIRRVLLATLSLGLAASRAAAQDQTPPGTLLLGPVHITPTFLLRDMGVDNNVKNESTDPKSDFTFTMVPRATVALRIRRVRTTADLVTEYVYFKKYSEEGGTNTSIAGRVEADLGRLRPYATGQAQDTKARPNAEIDARARHHDVNYGAGASLLIASRTRLLVSGTTAKINYDPGEEFRGTELQQTLDGRRASIEAGLGFDLTPLTTLNLIAGHDQTRFTLARDRDSNSWRFAPTLNFSSEGLLTGSASVGYRHFDAVSPLLPDYSGVTAAVAVGATIYGRHQFRINATRDVQYSYNAATQYYVNNGIGGTYTLVIVGPFDVRVTGSRARMDYRSNGTTDAGSDRLILYGGGFGYHITARARVGVDSEWSHRTSTLGADREYDNHRLFAGLTWGIQP